MRKIIALLLVTSFFTVACGNDQTKEIRYSYSLKVSPGSLVVPPAGGEFSFTVESIKTTSTLIDGVPGEKVSENVPYSVSVTGEGFSLGDNNTVIASENKTSSPRSGTVTVKITESTQQARIAVTQEKGSGQQNFPLPGGKKNFSIVSGHFALSGKTWAQLSNIEFDAATGTFKDEYWYWDTDLRLGKTPFNSYYGTIDGSSGNVYLFTPKGWIYPEGLSKIDKGAYSYNETSKTLEMQYENGRKLKWIVRVLDDYGGLAELEFDSSSRDITHARGYGSNADWTVFKKLADVPRVTYSGKSVLARRAPDGYRNWFTAILRLGEFEFTENGGALRYHQKETSAGIDCPRGIIYHYSSNNNSRAMIQNHFVACLAGDAFPTYTRNLHPYAVQQLISDAGDMVGFVMVEQQNPPEAMYDGNYQYQIRYVLRNK